MKRKLGILSVCVWACLTANAELIISINVDEGSNRAAMSPTDLAGANSEIRVGNWNNFRGGNKTLPTAVESPNAGNFVYDDGTVVGGSFAVSVTGATGFVAPTAINDAMLYAGHMPNNADGAQSIFTLTDIPFALYDIYVYAQGQAPNVRGGSVALSGGPTYYHRGGSSPANDGTGYVAMSTTVLPVDKSTIAFGNYAHYQGLTASSQTITATAHLWGDHARQQVYGFQIVEVIPEPGSFVLIGMGALVLGLLRAKRRRTSFPG